MTVLCSVIIRLVHQQTPVVRDNSGVKSPMWTVGGRGKNRRFQTSPSSQRVVCATQMSGTYDALAARGHCKSEKEYTKCCKAPDGVQHAPGMSASDPCTTPNKERVSSWH